MQRPPVPRAILIALVALLVPALLAGGVGANHSWGSYHWARTGNPFTLELGNNLGTVWDPYLLTAASEWSESSVLDATVVPGGTPGPRCRPSSGRVEVCAASYGNNGWLGLAQIWISGKHITHGTAKMNNTYFGTAKYNTEAWRSHVMCQEVAHTFGLAHRDETNNNKNLGSCMDYTNDPDGGVGGAVNNDPSNEHPSEHDFKQLELIYAHLDSRTTVGQAQQAAAASGEPPGLFQGGRWLHDDLYVQDLGHGKKLFTFVIWAEKEHRHP